MSDMTQTAPLRPESAVAESFMMLWRDKFAFVSALFLLLVTAAALFGPALLPDGAMTMNLRGRNAPPFEWERGWVYLLGADNLGRAVLARLVIASRYTLMIAVSAVLISLVAGTVLGLLAGYCRGRVETVIVRGADILMSFPSLLLALIVLFVLSPSVSNVVIVLAISRLAVYLRTCRAEVMEIRERQFVTAARALGASHARMIFIHILPNVIPTLMTLATLEFSAVMLSESSLSFLGLGVQAPAVTWGLMVAEGRGYLASAWWLSFWPGVAISLTAISANLLANWVRTATDPAQRWRLEWRAK
ncbi:ABC transporter permease [Falsirhodobacter xinxiangensis]|uniref:ABC transporter permease n=1 Tax=Falsirhodobacter xinxiangensis TaxID=2530049 RepID=UPI00145B9D16|nr:ABC transporter permease [Rhodobacter xinxiangensis]